MIENYKSTFLEGHSQAIESAALRCPAGGWKLHQAREECAKILGLADEWLQFLQKARRALETHAAAHPLLWSKARKVSDVIVGGTFSRAAHESEGADEKSRFLRLRDEHDNYQMRFEGLLRALLQSEKWYAEASPNGVVAMRERVFSDAWEFLEIRSWHQGRVCAPDSRGFFGIGHLHGVRIFPASGDQIPSESTTSTRFDQLSDKDRSTKPRQPAVGTSRDPDFDMIGATQMAWVKYTVAKSEHKTSGYLKDRDWNTFTASEIGRAARNEQKDLLERIKLKGYIAKGDGSDEEWFFTAIDLAKRAGELKAGKTKKR